ncbi:hypothetical protein JCM3770_007090 [Rhodotorula araucariae]
MPPPDAPPPSKRRRTLSPQPPHRPTSRSPPAAKPARRNPLEGFDEDEELPAEGDARHRHGHAVAARDSTTGGGGGGGGDEDKDEEDEHCAICLSPIENKTVVYPCHHGQFCWGCIRAWTDQSRKCPLCLGPIEHLIHNVRSPKDYQVHYLLPLHAIASTSTAASDLLPPRGNRPRIHQALPRHALYGHSHHNRYSSAARRNNEDETTWRERQEERALERRRYIYREGLYAKHVASNRYTGFKPFSPQTFATNADLKAKVIKFIRRELQVFPAVDVAFLTTYLVSIASQLDLRSSAAIRLIADFLSEQDAQHLVHEITTFARSPFKSLDGYDRFVQYGRPHRDVPEPRDLEDHIIKPEDLQRDAPRFEEHMWRNQPEDDAAERARPRPPPPVANLPPHPSREVLRSSQGDMLRDGGADKGYGPRAREPSPPPLPGPPRRYSGGGAGSRRRSTPSPPREPDWRDRDERYTGSYYLSSQSRRDGVKGGRYPPPPSWARGQERRYREERERRRSRSSSRQPRHRSPSPRAQQRSASGSRSPSPARSLRSRHPRSPSGSWRERSSSRSRTLQSNSRSPAPEGERGRSRSLTPLRRTASQTPPRAANDPVDAEQDDAISLIGPSFSSAAPTPRAATPTASGPGAQRPTLSIFGAARRLLANGRVVTLSEDGRASLHSGPEARELPVSGPAATTRDTSGKGKGKAAATLPPHAGGEPYDAVPGARPASPAGKSLLARLGGAAPASVASTVPPNAPATPAPASAPVPGPVTAPAAAAAGPSLRAKLQARLTAEYREALAAQAAPSAAAAGKGGGDLQARLTAEKALAHEELTRAKVQAALAARSRGAVEEAAARNAPTTFSQATRELLLARLEEERLLAERAHALGSAHGAGAYELDCAYGHEVDYAPLLEPFAAPPPRALASAIPPPASPLPPVAPTAPKAPPAKSENALKATLLEKRKAAVEAELRQKLLAKRKSAGGEGGSGTAPK